MKIGRPPEELRLPIRFATRPFRGVERVGWSFAFAAAAYNLIRLPKLIEGAAST